MMTSARLPTGIPPAVKARVSFICAALNALLNVALVSAALGMPPTRA
jgi:hypothetical protein